MRANGSKRSRHTQTGRMRALSAAIAVLAVLLVASVATSAAWAVDARVPKTQATTVTTPGSAGTTTPGGAGTQQTSGGSTDLLGSLDGSDPFCSGVPGGGSLDAAELSDCHVSGSVAEPYPISSYGIDVQSPSVTSSIANWVGYALESIGAIVWEILLYAIRGVLLLLQWAFSLDLLNKAMGGVTQALDLLHNGIFGSPWLEAALSVLALWGIWNGLVRRKTIETLSGLIATVAMMLVALVVIAQPQATVGRLSNFADQASLTTLSALSRANVAQPARSFASAEGNLFTALVLRPWCALEFGSVSYCTSEHDGTTVADIWLAAPANSANRQQLYQLATTGNTGGSLGHRLIQGAKTVIDGAMGNTAGELQDVLTFIPPNLCPNGAAKCAAATVANNDIKNHSQNVQMQSTGGNMFDRLTLLAIVVAGLSGAVCVLLYMAIKLLFASVKLLLLLLGLPVILLVAAFGESGRMTLAAYGKRTLGAIITRFVFAVMLAVVLLTAGIIESLPIGWFSLWLINIVFWWGIFFERRVLIQFLELDRRVTEGGLDIAGRGAPFRVTSALIGGFAAWRAARGLTRGALAVPRALERHGFARRTAGSAAMREVYRNTMTDRARAAIGIEDGSRAAQARAAIMGRDARVARVQAMRDDRVVTARGVDNLDRQIRETTTPATRTRLEARRAGLATRKDALDMQISREQSILQRSQREFDGHRATLDGMRDRNRAEDPVELRREVEQRQSDVAPGMTFPSRSPEDRPRLERSLRWAGIDPAAFDSASPVEQRRLARGAIEVWNRDRDMSARLTDPGAEQGLPEPRSDLRHERQHMEVRAPQYEGQFHRVAAQERRALRNERRMSRSRPRR